jgi:cysteinyl-tRNA synthetase
MSLKILGKHFDIHGGGLDLVFPHHENELVQSESFTGVPFASYWMHNGLLTREGRKISKSDPDTIVLMGDLLAEYQPDAIRLLLLSSHYRRPIDYGPTRLAEIARSLGTFQHAFDRFKELTGESFDALEAPARRADDVPAPAEVAEHRRGFLEAMDDDFNTGGAVGELFEIVRILNRMSAGLSPASDLADYRAGMVVLKELSNLLGLFAKPPEKAAANDALTGDLMALLIDLRARLRKEKQYALADEVRNRLTAMGVTLEDGPEGTRWRVEPKR